ncbi:MAG TPA: calcium-binding protein, partial [Mycobacteriales bacterium]|nr:calcium-binding protein [Mycobacteriales bacterium]
APGPNLNCTSKGVPVGGSGLSPGTVVDGAGDPTLAQLDGNQESNLILADNDPDVDLLRGYEGPYDTLVGSRHSEVLEGGAGDDFLTAKEGPDRLDGGPGDDTLDGGPGDDRLADVAGHNRVDGGTGDDQLSSAAPASGGLFGGDGDDQLALQGRARVTLAGGAGDDGYRLDGASARRIFELPAQGLDTIRVNRSTRLPANVERVVGRGRAGLKLSAGVGDQDLIGSAGPDTLTGGPGADVLRGRRGDDTLLLSRHGFDHARGGPGADRFVPLVAVARTPRTRWSVPQVRPSAHLIEDLDVREGDRIVLSTRRLGRALARLRGGVRIRHAAFPRGNRPQLLFTRRDSLLRFDPDGRRGRPPVAIAIVKGRERLRAAAIRIVTN